MRAVTNAGPLIHLSWVDRLDLLAGLFIEVVVPQAVQREVLTADAKVPGVDALQAAFAAGWLVVRHVENIDDVVGLMTELDRGESEAIVLAEEIGADLLLLDDRRARLRAGVRGVPITGTVGVLRMARERGLIEAAAPILEDLRRRGFRISTELLEAVRGEETDE